MVAGSWSWALFAPSAFFFVTGAAVFCTLGSSDAQDFSDDRPFWCAAFPPHPPDSLKLSQSLPLARPVAMCLELEAL